MQRWLVRVYLLNTTYVLIPSANAHHITAPFRVTKLVDGRPLISTAGPDPATGQIIPQMFFQFRGTHLFPFSLLDLFIFFGCSHHNIPTHGNIIHSFYESSCSMTISFLRQDSFFLIIIFNYPHSGARGLPISTCCDAKQQFASNIIF